MPNIAAELKKGAASVWNDVSKAWAELLASIKSALGKKTAAPSPARTDSAAPENGPLTRLKGWAFMPAHVLEDTEAVIVRIDAPGMRREDFAIEIFERSLKVRGVRRAEQHVRTGRWQFSRMDYGSFCRYFVLPSHVHPAQGAAVYRDGVLRIEIPKAQRRAATRISVQSL